jgi:hypothetical protein
MTSMKVIEAIMPCSPPLHLSTSPHSLLRIPPAHLSPLPRHLPLGPQPPREDHLLVLVEVGEGTQGGAHERLEVCERSKWQDPRVYEGLRATHEGDFQGSASGGTHEPRAASKYGSQESPKAGLPSTPLSEAKTSGGGRMIGALGVWKCFLAL